MKKLKQISEYFFIGFSFLSSKKIFAILTVAMFISLLDVSLAYKDELLIKEQEVVSENIPSDVKYYNADMEKYFSADVAIDSRINCYKESVAEGDINDNIKVYNDQLKALYNESGEHFSFLYRDLYSGFTVSYNEEAPIETASTIKAPAMIYLYEKASIGEIDLNEELIYDGRFYSEGSGVLKDKEYNTSYTIDTLINYTIHDSDNIAYAMLMNRFGRENIYNFWAEKGTKNIFMYDTIWGTASGNDAVIYMSELYNFYIENEEYGTKLMNYFKNADWKQITDKNGNYNTANKGGWADSAFHDIAIVFDKNPYILAIYSNTGNNYGDYRYLFDTTSKLVGNLHMEYWKQKMNNCNNIEQY